MDEIARVKATQNSIEMVEVAGNSGGKYLNCKHLETKKCRNFIAKVMNPC